jgi:hypothetical protein
MKERMRLIAFPFMLMAAAGFLLSLTVHIMALFGKPLPGCIWVLHVAIFALWIPAIWITNRRLHQVDRKDQWDAILANCPVWMRRAITIVFAYAIVNFFVFMASTMGHPKPTGTAPPSVIRGFSGHWMIFYAVAFVSYYSAIARPRLPDRHNANNDFIQDEDSFPK